LGGGLAFTADCRYIGVRPIRLYYAIRAARVTSVLTCYARACQFFRVLWRKYGPKGENFIIALFQIRAFSKTQEDRGSRRPQIWRQPAQNGQLRQRLGARVGRLCAAG
jgi:hypothetical protein